MLRLIHLCRRILSNLDAGIVVEVVRHADAVGLGD